MDSEIQNLRFACCACSLTFKSKKTLSKHLLVFHQIRQRATRKRKQLEDIIETEIISSNGKKHRVTSAEYTPAFRTEINRIESLVTEIIMKIEGYLAEDVLMRLLIDKVTTSSFVKENYSQILKYYNDDFANYATDMNAERKQLKEESECLRECPSYPNHLRFQELYAEELKLVIRHLDHMKACAEFMLVDGNEKIVTRYEKFIIRSVVSVMTNNFQVKADPAVTDHDKQMLAIDMVKSNMPHNNDYSYAQQCSGFGQRVLAPLPSNNVVNLSDKPP